MTHLKRNGLIFIYVLLSMVTEAQNLVLNPSFEEVKFLHKGFMWKTANGTEFTDMSVSWLSPHGSSPDYLDHANGRTYIFKEYNVKLRNYRAIDGNKHVGISVYGCHRKSGACREYVQTQLTEPLEAGKEYSVEFWVSRIRNGAVINNLGAFFSVERPTSLHIELEGYKPQVLKREPIGETPFKWEKISGTFTADKNYQYLTVGNFFDDKQTQLFGKDTSALSFAYYFLDQISVEAVDKGTNNEFANDLDLGKNYILKDVNFVFADTILLQESYPELNRLLSFMLQNPETNVEIEGHTDSFGESKFNIELSKKRSEAICTYLVEQGIDNKRMITKSKGDLYPIATNETEAGRKQNRRVEIKILKN